jgi:hypothetical protein
MGASPAQIARRRARPGCLVGAVYLHTMAEDPPAPIPPEEDKQEAADRFGDMAGGASVSPSGRSEREAYGPLTVARHRKDDGRELILYTRRQPE